MDLIRKLVSGILATVMAVRLPHEALEAVAPVHSHAPEPPHNHPELHEPEFASVSDTGVIAGGSTAALEIKVIDNISVGETIGLQILEPSFGTL